MSHASPTHPKRIEELQQAQLRLKALVEAACAVGQDATARAYVAEVLMVAGYLPGMRPDAGTVDYDDFRDVAILGFAHCSAGIEKALQSICPGCGERMGHEESAAGECESCANWLGAKQELRDLTREGA